MGGKDYRIYCPESPRREKIIEFLNSEKVRSDMETTGYNPAGPDFLDTTYEKIEFVLTNTQTDAPYPFVRQFALCDECIGEFAYETDVSTEGDTKKSSVWAGAFCWSNLVAEDANDKKTPFFYVSFCMLVLAFSEICHLAVYNLSRD